MKTQKESIWLPEKSISLLEASNYLLNGQIIGIPTETVYGLAADAENYFALKKIFHLKKRPETHPVIVHIPHFSDVNYWVIEINVFASALIEAFWPGPLTLLFRKKPHVLSLLTGNSEIIGLRCPSHPVIQSLLKNFALRKGKENVGLAAPSANYFGGISPTKASHVFEEFHGVIPVLDGGDCDIGIESTIVDVSSEYLRILRPGHVSEKEIMLALDKKGLKSHYHKNNFNEKNIIFDLKQKHSLLVQHKKNFLLHDKVTSQNISHDFTKDCVSGCLLSHYAPKTPLYLFNLKQRYILDYFKKLFSFDDPVMAVIKMKQDMTHNQASSMTMIQEFMQRYLIHGTLKYIALVVTDETYQTIRPLFIKLKESKGYWGKLIIHYISLPNQPQTLAFHLYDLLRQVDQESFDHIWFEKPPDHLEYLAVNDRLCKAAKSIIG